MTFEEKSAWIMALVAVGGYATYLTIILGQAQGGASLAEVSYVSTMLWTIGSAIAASILLHIVVVATSTDRDKRDQRDKEINRFGEYVGQSFLAIGGVAALLMAMAELDHFWIANAIYLAFVLSGLLSSVAKIFAYRGGFQQW